MEALAPPLKARLGLSLSRHLSPPLAYVRSCSHDRFVSRARHVSRVARDPKQTWAPEGFRPQSGNGDMAFREEAGAAIPPT